MSEENKSEENKGEKDFADKAKDTAKEIGDEAKGTAKEFGDAVKETVGSQDNKKILAGILGILFGSLGVHKFILGYNKEGAILLGATIIGYATSCLGIGFILITIPWIIGVIEGIIYLTKSDEEFFNTYQAGKKPWF
ncbi:TM2 domain-containing protein [Sinomicrobium kalidii]|uniref:TM2 domain-containing protein n=1 Tax=Sinomicrobium kalidii TaxID=2900738 RepID=UPI001E2ECB6F|nr:TM2 domain-containing protein [Sinomicrobium kalidii]UGU14217.1 TM2 domain-containing protein [Sinomicrobium kalidii]